MSLVLLVALSLCTIAKGQDSVTCRFTDTDRHSWAREKVQRTISVTNSGEAAIAADVNWQARAGRVELQSDSLKMAVPPHATAQRKITFQTPDVKRPIDVTLHAMMGSGSTPATSTATSLRVYPREEDPLKSVLKNRRIGVFDPCRAMAHRLAEASPSVRVFATPDSIDSFQGDAFIVHGSDADLRRVSDALGRRGRARGGRLGILFLEEHLGAGSNSSRAAAIAAPGHPILRDLEVADVRDWREDGTVGRPAEEMMTGSFRRILTPLNDEGAVTTGALLVEHFIPGAGSLLYCRMPILEGWDSEPMCRSLFCRMLNYIAIGGEVLSGRSVAFLGDPRSPLLPRVAEAILAGEAGDRAPEIWSSLPAEPLPGAVLMDGSRSSLSAILEADAKAFGRLKDYVCQGGILVLLGLAPEDAEDFRWALNEDDRIVNYQGKALSFPDASSPLLWGNTEAEWREMAATLTKADYVVTPGPDSAVKMLVDPGVLAVRSLEKGKIVFLQLNLQRMSAPRIRLLLNQLLANLGVAGFDRSSLLTQ